MKNTILFVCILTYSVTTQAQCCFPFVKNEKTGYEDASGKIIVAPKYDEGYNFFEGLAVVKLNEKYGFIDTTGKEVIPLKYDYVENFSEGFASVQVYPKWTFINKKGIKQIPPTYEIMGSFIEGMAVVGLNDKWGYIDTKGKLVIPLIYQHADDFGKDFPGKAVVKLNGEKFLIDKNGIKVKQ